MNFYFFRTSFMRGAITAISLFTFTGAFAQFTPGNLVVLQAGDGSTVLANTGNRIVLREFSPLGLQAFSVTITSTAAPLAISGSATSEGMLSLSADGRLLVFAGYATTVPFGGPMNGATSSNLNRAVGTVNMAGSYTRVATSSTFFSTANIRGATSDGQGNFWASGSSGGGSGTSYFGLNSPQVLIQNSLTNTRAIAVFNNNLYFSTASGQQGIVRVGNGYPLLSGQSNSLILNTAGSGTGTASPYGFWIAPSQTLCYVADDRSAVNGGGVQKWSLSNGSWSLLYTLNVGNGAGARGVVADISANGPVVYATTDESSANRLVAITDVGPSSTATVLATASANTIFRGLSFSPTCEEPQINSFANTAACPGQTFTITPAVSGTEPLNYIWTGPASFSSGVANPSAISPGTYSLSVSNACGSVSAVWMVTLSPLPVINLNPFPGILCPGGTASVIASGAASYTWNNGQISPTLTASPGSTSFYTVTATSSLGCVASRSMVVIVTPSLQVNANPVSVCPGTSGTLTATGAASFTWTPTAFGQTIAINITSPTVYTVTGSAPGCTAVSGATVQASIAPSPTLIVPSATLCAGNTATLTAFGAASYSWSIPDTGPLVFVTPSVTTVYTVNALSVDGCTASAQTTVDVLTPPMVSLSIPVSTVCSDAGALTFSGNPSGGFFVGPGMNASQFIPALAGVGTFSITYLYTSSNGCSGNDTQSITVVTCTFVGLHETEYNSRISISPVPAQQMLRVSDANFTSACTLEIFSASGQKLRSVEMQSGRIEIPLTDLPAGLYFLASGKGVFKFLKE